MDHGAIYADDPIDDNKVNSTYHACYDDNGALLSKIALHITRSSWDNMEEGMEIFTSYGFKNYWLQKHRWLELSYDDKREIVATLQKQVKHFLTDFGYQDMALANEFNDEA